jgi:hypothetical protein
MGRRGPTIPDKEFEVNWGSTWDFLWHFLIIFAWIAYLLVLFQILVDLLWRDTRRGASPRRSG